MKRLYVPAEGLLPADRCVQSGGGGSRWWVAIISAEQQCVMKGLSRRGGSGVHVVLISPPARVVQTTVHNWSHVVYHDRECSRGGRSRDHEWWPVSERVVSRKRLILFPREHKVPSKWLELLRRTKLFSFFTNNVQSSSV